MAVVDCRVRYGLGPDRAIRNGRHVKYNAEEISHGRHGFFYSQCFKSLPLRGFTLVAVRAAADHQSLDIFSSEFPADCFNGSLDRNFHSTKGDRMKTYLSRYLIAFLAFTLVACERVEKDEQALTAQGLVTLDDFKDEVILTPVSAVSTLVDRQQKLLRSGTMVIEVLDFDSAVIDLGNVATQTGGYVANISRSQFESDGKKGTNLDLRIPAMNFEVALQVARTLGKVKSERVEVRDVTEEMIDLDARLNTQEQLENRLLALLNMRTGGLEEILEVETKLADVRQEIESVQGRLRHLENYMEYSKLSVKLVEPGDDVSLEELNPGPWEAALDEGIDGVVGIASWSLQWLIILLPVLLVMYSVYWLFRPALRRMKDGMFVAREENGSKE